MSDVKIPLNSNWSTFDPLSRSYPYSLIWQGSMAHNFFLRSGVSHEDFSYPHLCIMYIRKENVKQEEIAANSNADRPRWDVAFHKTSTVFNLNHKIVNCRFLKANL